MPVNKSSLPADPTRGYFLYLPDIKVTVNLTQIAYVEWTIVADPKIDPVYITTVTLTGGGGFYLTKEGSELLWDALQIFNQRQVQPGIALNRIYDLLFFWLNSQHQVDMPGQSHRPGPRQERRWEQQVREHGHGEQDEHDWEQVREQEQQGREYNQARNRATQREITETPANENASIPNSPNSNSSSSSKTKTGEENPSISSSSPYPKADRINTATGKVTQRTLS